MKILFLIQGNDRPSSRYRVLQYLPYLKQQGVKAAVAVYPHGIRDHRNIYQKNKDQWLKESMVGALSKNETKEWWE